MLALYPRRQRRTGASRRAGSGRDHDLAEGLIRASPVVPRRHGRADGVPHVLIGLRRDALELERRKRLATPRRPAATGARTVPARPRGGREALDHLGWL